MAGHAAQGPADAAQEYIAKTATWDEEYHPFDGAARARYRVPWAPFEVYLKNPSTPAPRLFSPRIMDYRLLVTMTPKGNEYFIATYLEHVVAAEPQPTGWQAITYFRFEIPDSTPPAVFKGRYIFCETSHVDRGCNCLLGSADLPLEEDAAAPVAPGAEAGSGRYFTIVVTARNSTSAATLRSSVKDSFPTFIGLRNQGATCYLNSLLQTLFHLKAFRRAVFKLVSDRQKSSDAAAGAGAQNGGEDAGTKAAGDERKDVALQLARVFVELQRASGQAIRTTALTESFGWNKAAVFEQHDVQELARVLIDNMETKMANSDPAVIQKLFRGRTRKFIRCCGVERSSQIEKFYDIQLQVKGFSTLIDSLKAEVQYEHLTGSNKYHFVDPNTGENRMEDAEIGCAFLEFPPVLMVHLRRFDYDAAAKDFAKINDKFSFPLDLDLNEFAAPPSAWDDAGEPAAADPGEPVEKVDYSYRLHSVLVHSGSTQGGHYYAYISPEDGQQWFRFDDERVVPTHTTEAVGDNWGGKAPAERFWLDHTHANSSAYMLVYVRKPQWEEICGGPSEPPECLARYVSSANLHHFALFTEADIKLHVDSIDGQVEVLPDPTKGKLITVASSSSWEHLEEAILASGVFAGTDDECSGDSAEASEKRSKLRLWSTTHWHRQGRRGLGRPEVCISDFGFTLDKAVVGTRKSDRLPNFMASTKANPIPLYLSFHRRQSRTDRLTFIKQYLPHEGTGRFGYFGSIFCRNNSSVAAFVKDVCAKCFKLDVKRVTGAGFAVWVERGHTKQMPMNPPDLGYISDLSVQCDAKDGTILIIQVLPATPSRKIGVPDAPTEESILAAESLLGQIGIDRYNALADLARLQKTLRGAAATDDFALFSSPPASPVAQPAGASAQYTPPPGGAARSDSNPLFHAAMRWRTNGKEAKLQLQLPQPQPAAACDAGDPATEFEAAAHVLLHPAVQLRVEAELYQKSRAQQEAEQGFRASRGTGMRASSVAGTAGPQKPAKSGSILRTGTSIFGRSSTVLVCPALTRGSAETHYADLLSRVTVYFWEVGPCDEPMSPPLALPCHTYWTHEQTARALAPRIRWWPSKIRLWNVDANRKRKQQWDRTEGDEPAAKPPPEKSSVFSRAFGGKKQAHPGPPMTLGSFLRVRYGASYSAAARGVPAPVGHLIWEKLDHTVRDSSKDELLEVTITFFDRNARVQRRVVGLYKRNTPLAEAVDDAKKRPVITSPPTTPSSPQTTDPSVSACELATSRYYVFILRNKVPTRIFPDTDVVPLREVQASQLPYAGTSPSPGPHKLSSNTLELRLVPDPSDDFLSPLPLPAMSQAPNSQRQSPSPAQLSPPDLQNTPLHSVLLSNGIVPPRINTRKRSSGAVSEDSSAATSPSHIIEIKLASQASESAAQPQPPPPAPDGDGAAAAAAAAAEGDEKDSPDSTGNGNGAVAGALEEGPGASTTPHDQLSTVSLGKAETPLRLPCGVCDALRVLVVHIRDAPGLHTSQTPGSPTGNTQTLAFHGDPFLFDVPVKASYEEVIAALAATLLSSPGQSSQWKIGYLAPKQGKGGMAQNTSFGGSSIASSIGFSGAFDRFPSSSGPVATLALTGPLGTTADAVSLFKAGDDIHASLLKHLSNQPPSGRLPDSSRSPEPGGLGNKKMSISSANAGYLPSSSSLVSLSSPVSSPASACSFMPRFDLSVPVLPPVICIVHPTKAAQSSVQILN
ncbi:Ubiquitin carboxyl-terminal hydrolase 21 [Diplonema papillatum]|nr:Ubiquitin carboxyl-terminal hydrolase 21 [Diplonema papillatum]